MQIQKDDSPRSALIKKGQASYQPAPIFDQENFGQKPNASTADENGEGVVVEPAFDPEELKQQAEEVIAKAKEEADAMLLEAQKKSNKLVEQSKLYCQTAHANAEREGYVVGQEKGRVEAREELKNVLIAARETLKETKALHDRLAVSMEPGLAQLAIEIAEKVIDGEVKAKPETIIRLVKAHLDKAKERDQVILHVHPDDYDLVKKNKSIFAQLIPEVKTLDIVAEPKISRGSCMVETNLGTVDATFTTQLDAIRSAFGRADKEAAKLPEAPPSEELNAPEG